MNSQENTSSIRNKKLISITEGAAIAALYTVLTIAFAPISYGLMQCRVAQALTVLPVRKKSAVAGLTIGCALANWIGVMMGTNFGAIDILLGTLATLLAAITTRLFRGVTIKGIPFLSALMPVIFNGLIVGAELHFLLDEAPPFWTAAAWVAAGELISVFVLGLPFNALIGKLGILKEE